MKKRRREKAKKDRKFVMPSGVEPDYIFNFDGGCWPNPGGDPKWGLVIYCKDGTEHSNFHGSCDDRLPRTNNTAEFSGMLAAVECAVEMCGCFGPEICKAVLIRGDSQLAIRCMQCEWELKKSPHLAELAGQCRKILELYHGRIFFEWVPREKNARADSLT